MFRSKFALIVLCLVLPLMIPSAARSAPASGPATMPTTASDIRALFLAGSPQEHAIYLLKVVSASAQSQRLRTEIYARPEGTSSWQFVHELPAATKGVTMSPDGLVTLLDNGQWMIVGQSTGRPLPENAQIAALAGDKTIWAVGLPRGSSTTAPSTAATVKILIPTLFRMESAGWQIASPLPSAIDLRSFALGIAQGNPTIACASGGRLSVWQFISREWVLIEDVKLDAAYTPREIIEDGGQIVICLDRSNGPALLMPISSKNREPIVLATSADSGATPRAFAMAAGKLRYVYLDNAQVKERRLDMPSLQIDGPDQVLSVAQPTNWRMINEYANWVIIGIIVFVVAHAYSRREQYQQALKRLRDVRPAPYGQRLFAGLIDALPLIIGLLYARIRLRNIETIVDLANSPQAYQIILIAVAVWIGYTGLCEMAFGRTLGKMLTHLQVLRFDGSRPRWHHLLLRNVLRIIDFALPLTFLTVLYLPLRQRLGDLASGTFVAASGHAPEPHDSEGM